VLIFVFGIPDAHVPICAKRNHVTAAQYDKIKSILTTYKARNLPSMLTESVETGFPKSLL
jgi:hypothetical protein